MAGLPKLNLFFPQVRPVGIGACDQELFFMTVPLFQLFFPDNGFPNGAELFVEYEVSELVSGTETSGIELVPVLLNPIEKV